MDVTLSAILLSWKWRSDVALGVGAFGAVYLIGGIGCDAAIPGERRGGAWRSTWADLWRYVSRCSLRSIP